MKITPWQMWLVFAAWLVISAGFGLRTIIMAGLTVASSVVCLLCIAFGLFPLWIVRRFSGEHADCPDHCRGAKIRAATSNGADHKCKACGRVWWGTFTLANKSLVALALLMMAGAAWAGPQISWDRPPNDMAAQIYYPPTEPFEYRAWWINSNGMNFATAFVTNIPATTATNIGFRMPGGKPGWWTFAVAPRWPGFTNFGEIAVVVTELDASWFKLNRVQFIKIAP
jgi:hypothetical protein